MDPWNELFQGEVADEYSSVLAADSSNGLHAAGEGKENTGYTCGRTCSCGPEVCGKESEPLKTEGCDPAGGSVHYTSCRTCAPTPGECDVKASGRGEFMPRVAGWSTPPSARTSL